MPQNTFVGRDYEQTVYKEFLSKETPWLLLITGLAGIGKTTLLEKFRALTPFDIQVVSLDFDKEPLLYADPLKLLEDLAQLTKSFCDQQESAEFVETLKQGRTQIEELDQQTSPIIHDSERASVQVLQKVRRLRSALQEVRHQVRELTAEAFFTQLDTYKRKQLVIMLDTCELLNEPEGWEVGQWMMNEFLPTLNVRMYQRCFVVMASRVHLQSEIIDKQDQQHLALSMLDEPAVDKYLENVGIHDPLLRQRVYEITHGHALCISIISSFSQEIGEKALSGEDISELEAEFDERASVEFINDRILNRLNPPFRELTQHGVLLRNFNQPLLKAVFPELLPELKASDLFDQFIRFPYIESKGNYRYGFHELIREVLAKKTQKDHPVEWKQYHKRALDYFASNAGMSREMEHSQEWYYHAIAYDEAQGMSAWKEAIEKARMGGLDKEIGSLLQVVYDKTLNLSPISCAIRAYERGRFEDDHTHSERASENYKEALVLFRQVGSHPKEEADVLQAFGDVQRSLTKHAEALTLYEQAYALFQAVGDSLKQANVLKALGDMQRLLGGNLNTALSSYRQALSLFRRVGNRLDEANVLQAIGEVQQDPNAALESYKQALVLFRQFGSGSEEEKEKEAKLLRAIGDLNQLLDDKDRALESYKQLLVLRRGNVTEEDNVQRTIREVEVPEIRNRLRMLAKVRSFWINGVLEESLHSAALIALGLSEQRDAVANPSVANPWRLILQQQNQPASSLPPGTHITQVYDRANGELLILGEPGSGKTTLLLELTRDLLDRAQQDDTHPIPVVFNLSSWTVKRQPLTEWLIEELFMKYQVPRKVGQRWVSTEELLLLLDGLDEVALDYREACIDAMNAYRREHGLVPMVVCSRSAEYLMQTKRLLLQSAVVMQPLTREQIEEYLISAGEKLAAVREAFDEDKVLQELATTPLMLSIITLAYSGKPVEKFSMTDSLATRRQQILDTYVQRMFSIREAGPHYTRQQSFHWLSWLAQQLVIHNQTEFYLERMQLDWLPKKLSYRLYPSIIMGLVYGLGVGLVFGFFFGLYPIPGPHHPLLGPPLLFGLGCGSLMGLLNWLLFVLLNGVIFEVLGNRETKQKPEERDNRSEESRSQKIITFLGTKPVYGLIFGLLNGVLVGWLGAANNIFYESLDRGAHIVYQKPLSSGIIYGLLNLICFTIYFAVLGKLDIKIQPAEIVTWSWKSVRHNLARSIVGGLLFGLMYGVILGGLYYEWILQISVGLGIGVGLVLTFALITGLSHEMVSKQKIMTPNQGIRNSFRNSIVLGLVTGLMTGIGIGLPQVLGSGLHVGLVFGLVFGLAIGLNFWLRLGGTACILHALLRVCLWRANYAPLNYPRFLDFAVEHILLRRVGGATSLSIAYSKSILQHCMRKLSLISKLSNYKYNFRMIVWLQSGPVVAFKNRTQHTTTPYFRKDKVARTKSRSVLVPLP